MKEEKLTEEEIAWIKGIVQWNREGHPLRVIQVPLTDEERKRIEKTIAERKKTMKKLHDYLDYRTVRVDCKDGATLVGHPINVFYAEDNESGEDELAVETRPGHIVGLRESEIARIEIVEE